MKQPHIHILGIGGTFMGGIACLAQEKGFQVSGSDANIYPPMSTQLENLGIKLKEGYLPANIDSTVDYVVMGNALSRGNPAVEHVLNQGLAYISGPEWLAQNILTDRWVIAVAGTHGKTTTASMLTWVLAFAGMEPGFLIGGIPENFGVSARLGDAPFFVVEADEYDTAFFDKRSKFVHYRPKTLILNNLEFDHADIFEDLAAIQKQFHHLIRTVPGNGLIISPENDENLKAVFEKGCWSRQQTFGLAQGEWQARDISLTGDSFEVWHGERHIGHVSWPLIGRHNVSNAIACIAACTHAGIPPKISLQALSEFQSVKRRMELKGLEGGVVVYDDFAHHPTAIALTLEALRNKVGDQKIHVVLDLRSNTMRLGTHQETLPESLKMANTVSIYQPSNIQWDVNTMANKIAGVQSGVYTGVQDIINNMIMTAKPGESILVMSNGGFDNIHTRLLDALSQREAV